MTARPDILCIGSVLWDVIGRSPARMAPGHDVPGEISRLPGGVALNIALTLRREGLRPALLSAVGRDAEGEALVDACRAMALICDYLHRDPVLPTDRYMAIEAAGELVAAIADARSLEAAGAAILAPLADGRLASAAAPWRGPVALDGNLTEALLAEIAEGSLLARADLRVAPASPAKAGRLRPLLLHPRACLYLNRIEAERLMNTSYPDAAAAAEGLRGAGALRAVVTDGPRAVAELCKGAIFRLAPPPVSPRRVTGAGDALMAAHIAAEWRGAGRAEALAHAVAAAAAHVAQAPRIEQETTP
jgi:sugar/nucleoside kinase (ribokinase family)